MTYTNVNKVLEGDAEMTERYGVLAPRFPRYERASADPQCPPNEHGSIDFDLPEPVIEFDEEAAHDQYHAQREKHRAPAH